MIKTLALLTVAIALAGCATASPEQRAQTCQATDWERFGENDGRLGIAVSDRTEEFQDCADVGQPVNIAAYQAGRARGLKTFCTVENGYQVGYEGRDYERVCPIDLEADFLQGYAQGREDRPAVALSPSFGIGVGSGGGFGIGIGLGVYNGSYFGPGCRYRRYGFRRHCW